MVDALADLAPGLGGQAEKRARDVRVELPATPFADLFTRIVDRQGLAVGSVGRHRIERVDHGEDPGA